MKKLVKTIFKNTVFWYQWDDRYIGQRIALGKYEPYLTKLILEKIKPESVMVDVGANIGYYSLLTAKTAKKVFAIEPEELNFSILKKNAQSNGLKNIELIKAAAGSRQGKAVIKRSKVNPGAHKVVRSEGEIKMIRLDDLIKEKVDVIKIDVEGMEAEVIKGARNLIEKWKPIIFLEYGVNGRDKKMIEFLRQVYGSIFLIDEYGQTYRKIGDRESGKVEGNLMVKKEGGWEWGQVKDIRVKKWIKRWIKKYPPT